MFCLVLIRVQFVWEPSLVKTNALSSAVEAACLILSIDETVRNPQSEQVRIFASFQRLLLLAGSIQDADDASNHLCSFSRKQVRLCEVEEEQVEVGDEACRGVRERFTDKRKSRVLSQSLRKGRKVTETSRTIDKMKGYIVERSLFIRAARTQSHIPPPPLRLSSSRSTLFSPPCHPPDASSSASQLLLLLRSRLLHRSLLCCWCLLSRSSLLRLVLDHLVL